MVELYVVGGVVIPVVSQARMGELTGTGRSGSSLGILRGATSLSIEPGKRSLGFSLWGTWWKTADVAPLNMERMKTAAAASTMAHILPLNRLNMHAMVGKLCMGWFGFFETISTARKEGPGR